MRRLLLLVELMGYDDNAADIMVHIYVCMYLYVLLHSYSSTISAVPLSLYSHI